MDLINHIIEVIQEQPWYLMLFYGAYTVLILIIAIVFIAKGIPAICKWMIRK
jgi:hypothetical protein